MDLIIIGDFDKNRTNGVMSSNTGGPYEHHLRRWQSFARKEELFFYGIDGKEVQRTVLPEFKNIEQWCLTAAAYRSHSVCQGREGLPSGWKVEKALQESLFSIEGNYT